MLNQVSCSLIWPKCHVSWDLVPYDLDCSPLRWLLTMCTREWCPCRKGWISTIVVVWWSSISFQRHHICHNYLMPIWLPEPGVKVVGFDIDLVHIGGGISSWSWSTMGICLRVLVWWLKLVACQGVVHMHLAHFGSNKREGDHHAFMEHVITRNCHVTVEET